MQTCLWELMCRHSCWFQILGFFLRWLCLCCWQEATRGAEHVDGISIFEYWEALQKKGLHWPSSYLSLELDFWEKALHQRELGRVLDCLLFVMNSDTKFRCDDINWYIVTVSVKLMTICWLRCHFTELNLTSWEMFSGASGYTLKLCWYLVILSNGCECSLLLSTFTLSIKNAVPNAWVLLFAIRCSHCWP